MEVSKSGKSTNYIDHLKFSYVDDQRNVQTIDGALYVSFTVNFHSFFSDLTFPDEMESEYSTFQASDHCN